MAGFPTLKTGAVAQYPARKRNAFTTRILRFVDGSEQRFRDAGGATKRWTLRLDLLDEAEMANLEAFFRSQQGSLNDFPFTDPWDGVEYASCRLASDEIELLFREAGRGRVTLGIIENRS